jgi:hypothetical protein
MTVLALQDLGGDIVGCATDSALLLTIVFELRCQPKVSHLHSRLSVEEEIPQLEVAMDNASPMQILQCTNELVHVEHGLLLRQPLVWSLAHEFVQRLVRAHLKDDVDILVVLEVVVEMHNLFVVQRAVD